MKYILLILFLALSVVGVNDVFAQTIKYEIPINSQSDDVVQDFGGQMYLDLPYHVLGEGFVGLIFNDIPLVQNQVIERAYIQFTSGINEGTSIPPDYETFLANILGEDNANPTTFSTTPFDIENRMLVQNVARWDSPGSAWSTPFQRDTAQQTPDISHIIKEIISKSDWQRGNSLVFFFTNSDGMPFRDAFSYDHSNARFIHAIPTLVIEVSTPSVTPPIPSWIKNNAGWWAEGIIDDKSFLAGLDFLVALDYLTGTLPSSIPHSLKIPAGQWANDDISDMEFLAIMQDWIDNPSGINI